MWCLFVVVCWSLFVVLCLLFVVRSVLCVDCSLLVGMYGLLFVVC